MKMSRSIIAGRSVFITIVVLLILIVCKSDSQRLCGKKLTEALKFVCKNNYNPVGKRSKINMDYYDDILNFDSNQETPFMNKLYAGIVSPNIRRIKQGIVDECCRKPCSFGELSAYCYSEK